MTAPVVPTQQDREAADTWRREWANCRGEHTALVQAFARHRLAALEEAARVAEAYAEVRSGFMLALIGGPPNQARLETANHIATAIRSLKEPNNG